MSDTCQIIEVEHGAYVVGPVPMRDVAGLAIRFEALGWTLFDALIARKIGATLCAVSPESGAAWRRELGIE